MSAHAIDYLELYVENISRSADYYRSTYGFRNIAEADPDTGLSGAHSVVLGHGDIRLVLTSAVEEEHPAARFVHTHGDGVRDVALRTDDAAGDYTRAVAAGARAVAEPHVLEEGGSRLTMATVAATNDLVHTFVQRDDPSGPFLPGRSRPLADAAGPEPVLMLTVDHLALCLRPGSLGAMVDFYQRAFGLLHTYDEYIVVGNQAMDSKVVQDATRGITFTMVEPDPTSEGGQLVEFLGGFDGPGVQHVAFATDDIVRAARGLRQRGVEFLPTPAGYYGTLAERGIDVGIDTPVLRELDLLADRDDWGHLVQVFTRSPYPRRTVFFELIQRIDARTFGSGNIKALYEAVERERLDSSGAGGGPTATESVSV